VAVAWFVIHGPVSGNARRWSQMQIDPPILTAISALIGALIGGSTSLAAAIY